MARMMGLERPPFQLAGAVAIGAVILVLSDWLGRNLLFPWEIPGGILAAFIGAPYLVWLLKRSG